MIKPTMPYFEHNTLYCPLDNYDEIIEQGINKAVNNRVSDICSLLNEPVVIPHLGTAMIGTGLFFEIPEGYEVQIRPRSGLAAKNGVTVLNTPGTIDSDYRGEIKVILINLGEKDFVINSGDRIAQMVIAPVTQASFEITDSLSDTERGAGGFGSTGV